MSREYVSNKEFFQLLVDYKNACELAKEEDRPIPKIPDKIGESFILIATRLANRANFCNYTYKDEMIGDAIENCIIAVHSFNPEKSQNPFSYFTQISWFAFLRRLEKEKKQTYIKYKALESLVIDEASSEEIGEYTNFDLENEKMVPIIEKFEKKTKPKKPRKEKGLESFYRDGVDAT